MRLGRLLVVWLLAAAPSAAQTAFVTGTATDATSSISLSNISVAAYGPTGLPETITSTDQAGRFTLALKYGTYRLLAYDDAGVYATSYYSNASSYESSAQLDVRESLSGVVFQMVRGHPVTARVVSTGGVPLVGMVVAAYNGDGSQRGFEKTGGNGSCTLILPPGTYRFVAYDDLQRYATLFYPGVTSFEAAAPVAVPSGVSSIGFSLPLASKVGGSALDRATRTPVAALLVAAYSPAGDLVYSTATGVDGRFTMALAPGDYKFVATDADQRFAPSYFSDAASFEAAPSFRLVAGQELAGVDFLMNPVPPPGSRTTLFVPGAANTSGLGGAVFQTDLWIHNPSDSPISYTVTFLPAGQDNSGREGVALSLGPRSQVAIANVLNSLFRTTGAGGLRIDSDAFLLATSRTYNSASPVGTFGVAIAARPLTESLSRGLLLGLSNNASYRSNVAVLNPGPHPITVTFRLFRADGTALGQGTKSLAPLEWFQASTIFGFLGVDSVVDNAYATVGSPDGPFFSYASVVDQKSGDGSVIEAASY